MKVNVYSVSCLSHIGKRVKYEDNFLVNSVYLTPDICKQLLDKKIYIANFFIQSKVQLFAISDGMGGHNAGEIASRICVENLAKIEKKLQQYSSIEEAVSYLQTVVEKTNFLVCELSHKYNELKGMGATLIILLIFGERYAVLNIGDSRAYYFNNGALIQITKDHTEGQRMLDFGLLTRKELINFPAQKYLNRYVGFDQTGYILQADEYYPLYKKGIILLCSDGVYDFVSENRIAEILDSEENLEIAGKKIVKEAANAYNADNITLMMVPIGG